MLTGTSKCQLVYLLTICSTIMLHENFCFPKWTQERTQKFKIHISSFTETHQTQCKITTLGTKSNEFAQTSSLVRATLPPSSPGTTCSRTLCLAWMSSISSWSSLRAESLLNSTSTSWVLASSALALFSFRRCSVWRMSDLFLSRIFCTLLSSSSADCEWKKDYSKLTLSTSNYKHTFLIHFDLIQILRYFLEYDIYYQA